MGETKAPAGLKFTGVSDINVGAHCDVGAAANFKINPLQFSRYLYTLLMNYFDRIVDGQIERQLRATGAVLIRVVGRVEPMCLAAVTGSGFAHRRPDGVVVIPVQALQP